MKLSQAPVAFDPYDPWMTRIGVRTKRAFYQGRLAGKCLAITLALGDWLLPTFSRKLGGSRPRSYPITTAQWILCQQHIADPEAALQALLASTGHRRYGTAWGLGFPWMSKNGLYDPELPFVTHTPYAMEALLHLGRYPEVAARAGAAFRDSWQFLDALKIMYRDDDSLALSYAPVDEPRIVINANAYACYAYCLHYHQGHQRELAGDRALQLARWLVSQQQADGSWRYYADDQPGNFIDGFHSCFVLKNLIKAGRLHPAIAAHCRDAIDRGEAFVDRALLDRRHGLLRRFTERDIKDPFVWDLYDQAEYLGLLLARGRLDEARAFRDHVAGIFCRRDQWYCRKDFLGRLWGKNFYRWGIMPFWYHASLLDQLSAGDGQRPDHPVNQENT